MPDILIIGESDLRDCVPLDLSAVDCTEAAFAALSDGGVEMPPILSMEITAAHGEIDVKTALMPGLDSFAVKMSTGFFDNPKIGLPTASGLMVLFSADNGLVEAVLLDNGYLTDVRTAAAGAVAARHLAREDAASVTVMGTGLQARMQIEALQLVRPLTSVIVWGRDADKATAAARDIAEITGLATRIESDPATAVSAADVIVTTTPATRPIVLADWLRPGQHVTAMGSDQPKKAELEPACLSRADAYVADRIAQTRIQGELRAAIEAGSFDASQALELGDVVTGRQPGRRSPEDITIADLTGTGVQDTAIATLARERAVKAGRGTTFSG